MKHALEQYLIVTTSSLLVAQNGCTTSLLTPVTSLWATKSNPAVSAEAKKNMQELFKQCVETVGLCERVFEGLCHQNYQNAVKAEDHARARFWQEQLAILRPHVPAA